MTQHPLWVPSASEEPHVVSEMPMGQQDEEGDLSQCNSLSDSLSHTSAEVDILLAIVTVCPIVGTTPCFCHNFVPYRIVPLTWAVIWRFRALRKQLVSRGTINLRPLRLSQQRSGVCGLCGNVLVQERGEQVRCRLCCIALRLALGYHPLVCWLAETGADKR